MANVERRYADGYWDNKDEYLAQSWILRHNDDYLQFLVERVWKLTEPRAVVDFGCGYGRFGLKLMPLLPEGSTYTGFDQSPQLIAKAGEVWKGKPCQSEFRVGSIFEAPYPDSAFDLAISHTVLMHVPTPEKALGEMIRVTRDGGLVVTCDANRTAHNAAFHIAEIEEERPVPLGLFQKLNTGIRRKSGVDYDIGFRMPVLMHRAGLQNVQARVTDSVRLLFPPFDTEYKKRLYRALCEEGYGPREPTPEGLDAWLAGLTRYGISEEDARAEIDRELAIDFLHKAEQYHTVFPDLLTFSFGTVSKPLRRSPTH